MYSGGGGGGGLVAKSCPTLGTPWTVACQAPLSMGFSRQEYWSGLTFPSPGDISNPGIEPGSPAFQADALTSEPPEKSKDAEDIRDVGLIPGGEDPLEEEMATHSHGQRSLVGYSPWGHRSRT